jgi:chromosome segregation ATPase
MPSIVLDDFLNDIKIELQLAHKASVDDKNLDMIHRVFGEIKKLKKENEKLKQSEPTTDPIKDCMNDIINQVESREWRRVNEHRDRMMKKWKKEKAKVEDMKDDWEVATEKIGQENSDLHNEIKRLKEELKAYKSDARNQGQININREKEIQKLKDENENLKADLEWNKHEVVRYSVALEEEYVLKDEFEKLKDEADELSDKCIQHIEEKQKLKNEIQKLNEWIDLIDK